MLVNSGSVIQHQHCIPSDEHIVLLTFTTLHNTTVSFPCVPALFAPSANAEVVNSESVISESRQKRAEDFLQVGTVPAACHASTAADCFVSNNHPNLMDHKGIGEDLAGFVGIEDE